MSEVKAGGIGARLRRMRTLRGMAQEDLAERAGISRDLIAKLEQGRRNTARVTSLAALAGALDVELSALTDGRAVAGEQRGVLEMRRALTDVSLFPGLEDDDRGEPTPVGELRSAVEGAWRAYWSGSYTELGKTLPGLIGEARLTARLAPGKERPGVWAELAGAYQVTGCVLTQLGYEDLAYLAVERAVAAATESGDWLRTATLAGSLSWVLLNQGRFAEAERVALGSVDGIEPSLGKAAPAHVSVWGSLLLTALAATAAREDAEQAGEVLALARAAGSRLERDRNDYQTAFGPARVATEAVHAAVKLGQPRVALERARAVPGDAVLPVAARGRHLLDVAHAQLDTRQYRAATETLLAAERLSPQWCRHQTLASSLVGDLVDRHTRLPSALKGLAGRLRPEAH